MGLATGIYENLIYEALKRKLEALPDEYRINYISIDPAQAPRMLTNYVASLMNRLLSDDRVFEEFEDKIAFVNKVVEFIDTKWDTEPDDDLLINEKKLWAASSTASARPKNNSKQWRLSGRSQVSL